MKDVLKVEAKAQFANPTTIKALTPGALIDIFSLGGGENLVESKSLEETAFKAIWLIAMTFPKHCIRIKDLAKILCTNEDSVRRVIGGQFLEENRDMILAARKDVEEVLRKSGLSVTPIERSNFLPGLDYTMEVRTTFLEFLHDTEWEELHWNDGQSLKESP